MESHLVGIRFNLISYYELKYNTVKFYPTSTMFSTLIEIERNYTDYFPDFQDLLFLSERQRMCMCVYNQENNKINFIK